jgi:hypothetical protein
MSSESPTREPLLPPSIPPLQFLHVPSRPGTTGGSHPAQQSRRMSASLSKSSPRHHVPSSPLTSFPVYSLRKLPLFTPTNDTPNPSRPQTSGNPQAGQSVSSVGLTERLYHSARLGGAELPSSSSQHHQPGVESVVWTTQTRPHVSASRQGAPPPLLQAIEKYLQRELTMMNPDPDQLDAQGATAILPPHREAFRMFIEGMPSYASLLCNIMAAYDGVIQEQASASASAKKLAARAKEVDQRHADDTLRLQQHHEEIIRQYETSLQEANRQLDQLLKEREADKANAVEVTIRNLRLQIKGMEQEKAADLEKILTLVAAVKECDLRVRDLELSLQAARVQLDEMAMTKKLMADAQVELLQLKDQYRDAMPMSKHQSIKDALTDQLNFANKEIKRVRRLCISRGTLVDTLEKKVDNLTLEVARFRVAAGPKQVRELLTPRPKWDDIREQIPELAEMAAPMQLEMLDEDGRSADPQLHGPNEGNKRAVEGCRDTVMQVQRLVQIVQEQKMQIQQMNSRDDGMECHVGVSALAMSSSSRTGPPVQSMGSTDEPARSHSVVGVPTSIAAGMSIPATTRVCSSLQLPLLTAGPTADTLPYLRAVGSIPRALLEPQRTRELLFDFFNGNIRKQNDVLAKGLDVHKYFHNFATLLLAGNSELRGKLNNNAGSLTLYLLDTAARVHALSVAGVLSNPSPTVILWKHVMEGSMPLRIALDALTVLDCVREELLALAAVENKSRLRRSALNELLTPMLQFKARDEFEELRASIGFESTIDIAQLVTPKSRFMDLLFEQEVAEGMKLFAKAVDKLTSSATIGKDGFTLMLTTTSVLMVIVQLEPKTPQDVIDALIHGDSSEDAEFPLEHTLRALWHVPFIRRSAAAKNSA